MVVSHDTLQLQVFLAEPDNGLSTGIHSKVQVFVAIYGQNDKEHLSYSPVISQACFARLEGQAFPTSPYPLPCSVVPNIHSICMHTLNLTLAFWLSSDSKKGQVTTLRRLRLINTKCHANTCTSGIYTRRLKWLHVSTKQRY